MPKTDKIYAIVVTYNGANWIHQCLNSLKNSTVPVHIIVIDNASADNTVAIIEQEYPTVELIKSDENLGFGKGNNIGLRKAINENADYVFLLNQDAWVEADAIEKLIETHKQNTEYGIISPFHLKPNKTEIEHYFSSIISPNYCPNLINDIYFQKTNNIYPTKFVHAAAWLISKECLHKVGGFDPLFPHYGEDEDYVNRVKYLSFNVGICPHAIVYHDINFNIKKIEQDEKRNIINSLLKLKNINSSFRSNLLVYVKGNLDLITSLILYRKFTDTTKQIRVFYKTIRQIKKILKARKNSRNETAFLH